MIGAWADFASFPRLERQILYGGFEDIETY